MAHVIGREGDFEVRTARTLDEAIKALAERSFRVVLLDAMMPGMEGLPSVARVVEKAGDGRVVLFSGNVTVDFAQKALSYGAAGFIPKTLPLKSLPAALRLIDSGQVFMPVTAAKGHAAGDAAQGKRKSALTERQVEILRLVQAGKYNKEIARAVEISEPAVKMHLRAIFSKLNAKNRAHAVTIALSDGTL